MTVEEEKQEADKEKEENIEKARIRIIADNEQQLEDLQKKLDEKMANEETKLTEQMEQRKAQVLALKRQNLEDRIKMAGDISQN
jgi:LPS O-antigen subunit length determinant protein (WzzB/FepE family)